MMNAEMNIRQKTTYHHKLGELLFPTKCLTWYSSSQTKIRVLEGLLTEQPLYMFLDFEFMVDLFLYPYDSMFFLINQPRWSAS